MAQTYSTDNLALNDPTSAAWALAYVRFALRDKPNSDSAWPAGSLTDEEINALLEATKIQDSTTYGGDDAYYYVPHQVAADLLVSNPEWVTRWSMGGVSEDRPTPERIARGVLQAGRWINTSIKSSTNSRIGYRGVVPRL